MVEDAYQDERFDKSVDVGSGFVTKGTYKHPCGAFLKYIPAVDPAPGL